MNSLEERRYELLVQAVVDYALYMLDADGRVSNWNSGAQRIKGYAADEVIGKHFSLFYTPEDVETGLPARALATAAAAGRYEAEGWRLRKDGTRFWASVVIDPIRGDDGELIGFAKVTRDITERRESELRLTEAREQLFQSQKIEALGQLTGGLAHDFNNLLTAIISGAELALRGLDDRERVRVLLERVKASAERGSSLTRQLLAFARRQPLEPKVVDLQRQLPETAALLRHTLNAEIDLIVAVSDQAYRLNVDPGQLELALLNLGFNSRDALPEGGSLKLSARNATPEELPDGLVGDHVVISVADDGVGMPEEVVSRVFEPFFTTKGFGQGTGLGLSQVYGFAKQSNGDIRVESKPGKGTTVSLYMPALTAANQLEEARDDGRFRILLVEDDVFVAELAAELLQDLGYSAVTVHSAAEGLSRLTHERFDAVFSDIVMPGGLSGVELARRVRSRFPEMPVLLTTGYSESVGAENEFPVVPKPYKIEQLGRALERLLGRPARAI